MQKNPNFEWKPVSSGNEKFMIVLSWLVVAFIVIVKLFPIFKGHGHQAA